MMSRNGAFKTSGKGKRCGILQKHLKFGGNCNKNIIEQMGGTYTL